MAETTRHPLRLLFALLAFAWLLAAPALAQTPQAEVQTSWRLLDYIGVDYREAVQGGPGSATEPIALYTFSTLLQHLRFGYGSALSIIVFMAAFLFALVSIRLFGGDAFVEKGA